MIQKLRTKFVMIIMSIVTLMILLIFGLVYHFTAVSLETESIRTMQNLVSSPFPKMEIPDEAPEVVRLPYFALERDSDNTIRVISGGFFDTSNEEFLVDIMEEAEESSYLTGTLEKYNLRYLKTNNAAGKQIVVFADTTSEKNTLSHLVNISLLVSFAGLLGFLFVSIWLSRWAVKPVEEAFEKQKQFVADASHELKTPLTVIMANAELLQDEKSSTDEKKQYADNISQMSRQMKSLTEDMLEMARMDSSKELSESVDINLSEQIEDEIMAFEPLYFEQGLTLTENTEENLHVLGSTSEIRQLIDILLDNAMKYALEKSEVKLSLEKKNSRAVLSLSNECTPISSEELDRLFERFYCRDSARNDRSSYGLGLPLARKIAERHNGGIHASYSNGRITFTVNLPLSASFQ